MHETPPQTFTTGESAIISCSAMGNPAPQFSWSRRDGRSLEDGRFILLANGSLLVKSIQAEDRGTYKCTIKQSRGSKSIMARSQSIEVKVKGKI